MVQVKGLTVKQNMIYNSLGSLFYLGCQWLVSVLVIKLGSYEAGGMLTNCINITNVLFTVSTFGIRTYQVSDVRELYSQTDYVSTRLFTGATALLGCMVYVLFAMGNASDEARLCVLLYMVFKLTESISDVLQAIVQKAQRMDYIFKGMLMRGVLTLGLFAGVMVLTKSLPIAIVAMALGAYGVIAFYEAPSAKGQIPFTIQFNLQRILSLLKICWPLMLTSFFANAAITVPRTTLGTLLGDEALGYYGAVATPAVIVQTGSLLIFAPMINSFATSYDSRDKRNYVNYLLKTLAILAGFTAVMILGAFMLGEWGLTLIFGESIRPYAYLLPPVLLTASLIAISQLFTEILTVSRRLQQIMIINLVSTGVSLALSAVLIKAQGINGVNLALLAALSAGILLKTACLLVDMKRHFIKQEGADE